MCARFLVHNDVFNVHCIIIYYIIQIYSGITCGRVLSGVLYYYNNWSMMVICYVHITLTALGSCTCLLISIWAFLSRWVNILLGIGEI